MPPRKPEPTEPRNDTMAFVLTLAGVLVTVAVATTSAADLADDWGSVSVRTNNWFGPLGAWLGRALFESLGLAVFVLLAGWLALAVDLFLRPHLWRWLRRLAGWALLVTCAAVLGNRFGAGWVRDIPAGSGGTLGAWLWLILAENFTPALRAIVVGTALLAGVVLAIDHLLGVAARWTGNTVRGFGRKLRGLIRLIPRIWPARLARVPIRADAKPEKSAPAARGAKRSEKTALPASADDEYALPPLELLDDPKPFRYEDQEQRLRERAALLESTFADFGLTVRVVSINTGPVITQFEVALETGLRVNRVTALADDLALNLKVPSVRIVAPIPGKNTVGVEVPNEQRAIVRLKELIVGGTAPAAGARLPLYLGKDTEGRPLVHDLADMPHLLIAGRTGTGKSVCLNAVILSLLMTRTPDECKLILIDPKMLELSEYGRIPHLMHPVVTDMKKAEAILAWAVDKMDERYDILRRARVRGIAAYNELPLSEIHSRAQPIDEEDRQRFVHPMPSVVIIIDEFGDLMMKFRKDVEEHIIRLAQKSRAAGIHLILATQKPTVDIVTGLIKSNLPARICFQVTSRTDSRVVLDEMGADKLLGKGDMLFLQPGTSQLIRAQGTYANDDEIRRVVSHIEAEPAFAPELVSISTNDDGSGGGSAMDRLRARDELYEQAIEIVVREARGSTSLLQRALGIGYGRAARLVDYMAEDGIVGDYNGSQAREVLVKSEQWEQMKGGTVAAGT